MGFDDDTDCAHDWDLAELRFSERGAEMVSTCTLCEAVWFEPSASDDPNRTPLRERGRR